MPVVTIKLAGTLTREQKKKVAEEITATLERHAGKPASYTYIAFEELPDENWAIAGKLLDEMVPSINKTSDLVQEIAAASQEQSAGVGQINGAMGQLNKATQQNASASEELAATAEEMGGQAGQLQELMSFFHVSSGAKVGGGRTAKAA